MPSTLHHMIGKTLYDTKHQKVGTIDNVYVTRRDEQPVFASVLEGLLNMRLVFVPVRLTHFDGDAVVADTTKDVINKSPSIRAGQELDKTETQALYSYYSSTAEQKADTQPNTAEAPQAPQHQPSPPHSSTQDQMSPQVTSNNEPPTNQQTSAAPEKQSKAETPIDESGRNTLNNDDPAYNTTDTPEAQPSTLFTRDEQEISLHQSPPANNEADSQ